MNVPLCLCSTADITLSSAPLRPRRVPKMARISPPKRSGAPGGASAAPPAAAFLAKNMSVPHSSSMDRSTCPPLPITNPTQSSGTCTMDMSSRFMPGSMCTGPTRCASTYAT